MYPQTLLANTAPPQPPVTGVPGVDQVVQSASWLSGQQISVWFAIVVILFGGLIFLVIKHLLAELKRKDESNNATQKEQAAAFAAQAKEQRDAFKELQMEEKGLSQRLLEYLEKDHNQTVVLVREGQTVMHEVISLLKDIKQERHDDRLIRTQNQKMLTELHKQHNPPTDPPTQ